MRWVEKRAFGGPVDRALPVTVNFHPDRLVGGVPVLAAMAADGRYLSQFATGVGNGGLTAYPGGDRWEWESAFFGGAYDDGPAVARPVYGALDLAKRPVGAAPRFGSAHLRLSPAVLDRATFCYPDSHLGPTAFGTAEHAGVVDLAWAGTDDPLDDYVETHIHGPVRFDRDVEALVLDPSYQGTEIERAARRLPCPVEWHPGFELSLDTLRRHRDYRGPDVLILGAELARYGFLDPRILGEAPPDTDPQLLKRLWHCVARFGERCGS
ncbi:DUF3626 domain-containing protein [Nocardia thailandica]|uniref:DUF3626 domain-containing protein n=1 Tax=Nocardia thailandica TaxID=257275 RepID=UPI0002EC13D1|nr:DUF3626 domain-containing protein [Nocardia thailandica]